MKYLRSFGPCRTARSHAIQPALQLAVIAFIAATGPSAAQAQPAATHFITGAIAVPGERDLFTFHLTNRTRFAFDALTNIATLNWSLEGPVGLIVDRRSFTSSDASSGSILSLQPGFHRLIIDADAASTNAYAFRLLDLAAASLLTPGTVVSNVLNPGNETRAHQFTSAAGDRLLFDRQFITAGQSIWWRLIDPFGNEVFSSSFVDVGTITQRVSGTYTLLVEGFPGNSQPVTNTFVVTSLGNSPPQPFTGTPLAVGAIAEGTLAGPSTNAYLFSLAAETRLLLDSLTNSPGIQWFLEGPPGQAVNNRALNGTDWNAGTGLILDLPPGDYQLRVRRFNAGTEPYRFRLLELASASPLTPGVPVTASLPNTPAARLHQFNASAGARFYFDFESTNGPRNAHWELFSPLGTLVASAGIFTDRGPLTLPLSGVYLLAIEGYYGDDPGVVTHTFNVRPVTNTTESLPIGALVAGAVESPGQARQYLFSLAATARLYFDSRTSHALRWTLAGPDGVLVNQRSFSSADANHPVLSLPPGEYSLTVTGIGDDVGGFAFRLLDLEAASFFTPGLAVNGSINPLAETDAYRFHAAAGSKVYFNVVNASGMPNAAWRCLGPDGNEIFGGFLGDRGPLVLPVTGTYVLLVEGHLSDSTPGEYGFNLSPVTDGLGSLTVGEVVLGSIQSPGQAQVHSFALATAARLYFDSLTNSALRWSLDGPGGRLVNNRLFNASDANLAILNLPAGDYFLTVSGAGDDLGGYAFALRDLATALPLNPGSPTPGTTHPPNETDLYRFTVSSGARYFFDVTSATAMVNARWRCFDPYSGEVMGGSLSDVGPVTFSAGGLYTLAIEGSHSDLNTGSYTVNVVPVIDSVQPLVIGAVTSGTIATPGQAALHEFTLAAPARLYLDSRVNSSLRMTLTGPLGHPLVNRRFDSPDASVDPLTFQPGLYCLTVSGAGDATGSYQFRLFDLAGATPLTPGTAIGGTLFPPDKTDAYRFDADAGDRFFFDWISRTGAPNAQWRLFDPAGNRVFTAGFSGDQGTNRLVLSGTYHLLIEGYFGDTAGGAYQFNVVPAGHTSVPPFSGTPLVPGQTVSNSLPTAVTTNAYTFSLPAPGRLIFDSLAPSDAVWSLHTPAATLVNDRGLRQSDSTDGNPVLDLPAGNFQLTVRGAAGPYAFRLLSTDTALAFIPGQLVTNIVAPARGTALLKFTANVGDRLYFDGRARSGFSTEAYARLLPPRGAALGPAFTITSDLEPFTVDVAGEYFLTVEGRITDTGERGHYSFVLQPVVHETNTLTIGATVTGVIAHAGQLDAHRFTLPVPGRLFFDGLADEAAANVLKWTLTGPPGVIVNARPFWSSDSSDGLSLLNLPAGEYTIVLDADNASTPAYAFRLIDSSAALPFVPGTVVNGLLVPGSSTVLHRFPAAAGARFYFDGRSRSNLTTFPQARLITPLGADLTGPIRIDSDFGVFTTPLSGDYLVAVEGRYTEASPGGGYSFVLQPIVDRTNDLSLGATATGTLTLPGEVQAYRLTLANPTHTYFDTLTDSSLQCSITGPTGVVFDRPLWSTDSVDGFPSLELPAGEYLIRIDGNGATTGAYAFRLLDASTAVPFVPGNLVTNTIAPAAGTVLWQFNAAAGDRYYYDGRARSGFSTPPFVRILTPNGRPLIDPVRADADLSSIAIAQSGTHLLSVEGRYNDTASSGQYSFVLAPIPPNPPTPLFETNVAPDLVVASLTLSPPNSLQSGQPATVSWSTRNQGNTATAGSFAERVSVRHSTTGRLLISRTLNYDESTDGSILPGQSRDRQVSITLPDGPDATGALELSVVTDSANTVFEQNGGGTAEANNLASLAFNVTLAPYPDLQVTSLTVSPSAAWLTGSVVTASWILTNTGTRATRGPWSESLVVRNTRTGQTVASLSTDYDPAAPAPAPNPGGPAGDLAPGGSRPRSLSFVLPPDAQASRFGTFEVTVTTDSDGRIFEFNAAGTAEANNARTVLSRSAPDLVLQSLTATATPSARAGADLNLQWALVNQGNVPADGVFYERIVVRNTNTAEVLLNTSLPYQPAMASLGAILPGASRSRAHTMRLPDGSRAVGRLEVLITADVFDQTVEENAAGTGEANNAAQAQIQIAPAPYPDLVVTNVSLPPNGRPGQSVPLVWTIRNVGTVSAPGPWSDHVFLSSDATVGNDQFVTSVFFSGTLAAGQFVTRTQQVTLPAFGTGSRFAVVETDASSVIFEENDANNQAIGATPVTIPAALSLSLAPPSALESAGPQAVLATLTRNSDAAAALPVSITHDAPTRLIVPATATIPAGASAASFFVGIADDNVATRSTTNRIIVSAANHSAATNTVTILEDDTPALTLRLDATSLAENGVPATAVLTRNAATNASLVVSLFHDRPDSLVLPATLTIAPGQTNATFSVAPVNDAIVSGPRTVTIHASATDYPGVAVRLNLLDDDTVALTLQLSEPSVAENKLNPAATAVLSRSPVSTAPQRVRLRATAQNRVQIPDEVTIPANQPAVSFAVNVVDDFLARGAQSIDLVAEGLTDRGSPVPGASATASASLLILENDGPALTIGLGHAVIAEGAGTIATLTRNTPATNALAITLSASPPSQLSLPSSVVLALGQTSTNVVVTGVADGQSDGVQEVTIAAAAPGFNPGRAPLSVTDIDVPDLAMIEVSAPSQLLTEATLTVVWSVTNSGPASALGTWTDEVHLSRDAQGLSTTLLDTVTRPGPLPAGEGYAVARSFAAPAEPGTYWLLVRTDAGRTLAEGSERNNAALSLPVTVQPAYRASVETEIDAAVSGTPIPVSGRTFLSTDGSPAPFRTATVRVNVNQTRRTFSVLSDSNGRFSGVFRPIPGEAGLYTLGADHPRVITDSVQDQFTLLGLGALPWELNLRLAPQVPARGQIEIRNLSPLALTGLTISPEGLPLDCTVSATMTNHLAGLGTNTLDYVIASTLSTPVSGRFHLVITSLEGATLRLPVDFTVTPPAARLTATPGTLEAGMLRGTQTLLPFEVVNDGGAASGDLQVALPVVPWLSLISPSPLASLPPGARRTILLALNPAADLPLGRYEGTLVVHSTAGASGPSATSASVSASVPFQFRALSEARGDVRLTVTDEHTYYASGAPRVTNALVTLRDPFTGEIVTNGTSDARGEITFRDLPEGTYQIEALAARHSLTRGGVRISPGITTEQEVFMLRQEVTYEWRVVPSVIADHYRVVLEPQFETEVPQPNLVVENPEIVPLVFPGRTSQFAIRLRNTGLISLLRVRIPAPQHPSYIITPLVTEIEELPAQTTVSVPVTIRARSIGGGGGGGATSGDGFSPAGAPPACPGDDCVIQLPIDTRFRCGQNFVTKTAQVTLHAVCVPETGCDFSEFLDTSSPTFFADSLRVNRAKMECLLGNLDECDKARIRGYQRSGDLGSVHFPPGALPPPLDGTNFGLSAFCACGPQSSTNTLFMFGTNLLNSLGFPNSGGSGSTFSFVAASVPGPCNAPSGGGGTIEPGVTTPSDGPGGNGGGSGGGAGPGVCARVRLELSQDITMTRAAFRGTLVLDNAGATDLTGIQLGVEFRDANGNPASDRFIVRGPTLTGLTAINGQGRLPAGQNGTADFLFVPTLDAAPLAPVAYQIGGTLRFTLDGQDLTVPLLPGQITVLPEARLHLEYFQQRDVFSDDPFTPALEPAEPFALGLRVRNAGAGTARNFQIASAAPRIQENEKGLLIDFRLLGARVDDRPLTPSFNLSLGDIEPGRSRVVVWDMTSSLQGKFIDYRASFTHLDAFGATNLSLIDRVSVHELIHAVRDDRVGADTLPDFLVNDQPDPDNLPDTLYLSSGTNAPVALGQNATLSQAVTEANPVVELTATMPAGWTYLRLPNPGPAFRLVSVRRSDGRLLRSPENAWTTDRTFPSSIPGALREHTLHLVDHDSPGRYTLTFAPSPADTNAPASAVAALPASSPTRFAVEWDGTDNAGGTGIAHFDVYVSVDGGAYSNWLAQTTQRSALFTGALGQSYAFYSRATDLAGNTEIIPAIADAQTVASALNTAPSLLPIADLAVDEGAPLSLRPTALDTDLPRQLLTYRLESAPAGSTLDAVEGVIRWTPGESDGGTSNLFVLVVTDNGLPSLSVTQTFNVIIRELNAAPVFTDSNPDLVMDEETFLSAPVPATDPDRPLQTLTWHLEPGAPVGLSLNATTGLLSWLPGESRGPGEYLITVTVRDNGSPVRSVSRTIRLFVREANRPPDLAPIAPQAALVQTTLFVTNAATDADLPAQQFFFSLAPGAPRGARIHRTTGLFTWTPTADYARTTNSVTVQVTDNGIPSLTSTRTFAVVVGDLLQIRLGRSAVAAGQAGSIPISIDATVPTVRATLTFEATDPRLESFALDTTSTSTGNASLEPLGNNRFRILLEARPGQAWSGEITVAHLQFAASPAHASAFVSLSVSDAAGVQSDGRPVPRAFGYSGRVAYVGPEPLLEIERSAPPAPALLHLYGQPGPLFTLESALQLTTPSPIAWAPYWTGPISNLVETLTVPPTNQTRLFRAQRP